MDDELIIKLKDHSFYLFVRWGLILVITLGCSKEDTINPYNGRTTSIFNLDKTYGILTDREGNVYKTITIGTQTWMAENLRTTRFLNGDLIPEITDSTDWENTNGASYCNYGNTNDPDTIATYGRIYNWYTVNDGRKIAPEGWHIPALDEWKVLENYLGGDSLAGEKLKEFGNDHWVRGNVNATNESGFTAVPGGYRAGNGLFHQMGEFAYWWTATESKDYINSAWHQHVYTFGGEVGGCECPKKMGNSIRCVKDL